MVKRWLARWETLATGERYWRWREAEAAVPRHQWDAVILDRWLNRRIWLERTNR